MNITIQFATLTDQEVIHKINEGEPALFEILIRRNNPYLYKIGRSYGYAHHDVEDLMQEAFIAAYINLKKFKGQSTFKTWLTRIMLNKCYQKKHSKIKEATGLLSILDNQENEALNKQDMNTYSSIANKELGNIVAKALEQIPFDYKMTFALRELNGMSTSETATALNISETNVKVRLNRAKQMLRKQIESMYAPEDIFEFNLVYCDRIVNNVMKAINNL
jgi:RNA polymerase sigma factor (sigma-70 family)